MVARAKSDDSQTPYTAKPITHALDHFPLSSRLNDLEDSMEQIGDGSITSWFRRAKNVEPKSISTPNTPWMSSSSPAARVPLTKEMHEKRNVVVTSKPSVQEDRNFMHRQCRVQPIRTFRAAVTRSTNAASLSNARCTDGGAAPRKVRHACTPTPDTKIAPCIKEHHASSSIAMRYVRMGAYNENQSMMHAGLPCSIVLFKFRRIQRITS